MGIDTAMLREPPPRDHLMQMYTDDSFLASIVAEYIATGLASGRAAIVIATPAHARDFKERLAAKAIDVPRALDTDQLLLLDARATLAQFMVAGAPHRSAFTALIATAVERVRAQGYANVRWFGEMVDLLWPGNLPAALGLEALWNEVLADPGVSLLCAYRFECCDRSTQAILDQVVPYHSHLMPGEAAERFDAAVDRAWGDVFGAQGNADTLRALIMSQHAPMAEMPTRAPIPTAEPRPGCRTQGIRSSRARTAPASRSERAGTGLRRPGEIFPLRVPHQ
jgi:MEDS: MEthanogen/methylotroph, DcmR Sensory domain